MNRVQRLVDLEKEWVALQNHDTLCIVVQHQKSPVQLTVWKTKDNNTLSSGGAVTYEYKDNNLRVVIAGSQYTTVEIEAMRNELLIWVQEQV
jgi:hypothetical protein